MEISCFLPCHPSPIPSLSASIFSSSKEVLHKWKIFALFPVTPTQFSLYQHPSLVPQKRFFINGKVLPSIPTKFPLSQPYPLLIQP